MLCMPMIITNVRPSLYNLVEEAGLTSGLKWCLDPADKNSYPGSGTTWTDLSGNGYDLLLGDASSGASAPTFVGTAGSRRDDCYFSSPAGGVGFIAADANDSWWNGLHKSGWAQTFVDLDYWNGSNWGVSWNTRYASSAASNSRGVSKIMVTIDGNTRQYNVFGNGTGGAFGAPGPSVPPGNEVFMNGMASKHVNTNNREFTHYRDGTYTSGTYTDYFLPSSTDSEKLRYGCQASGGTFMSIGRRIYGIMAWNYKFTQTEYDALRTALLKRHAGI